MISFTALTLLVLPAYGVFRLLDSGGLRSSCCSPSGVRAGSRSSKLRFVSISGLRTVCEASSSRTEVFFITGFGRTSTASCGEFISPPTPAAYVTASSRCRSRLASSGSPSWAIRSPRAAASKTRKRCPSAWSNACSERAASGLRSSTLACPAIRRSSTTFTSSTWWRHCSPILSSSTWTWAMSMRT